MRYYFENATIFTDSFTIADKNCRPMCIEIERGEMYVSGNLYEQTESDTLKAEREKVWEMAKAINLAKEDGGMRYVELEDCFGTKNIERIMKSYSVDEALEKYEAWKENNSVEELVKSLKPQDVVAYNSGIDFDYRILMITRVIALDGGKRYTFDGITRDGRSTIIYISIDDSKFTVVKIGRVVETTDILGEIKKIEDEWRKNN